MKTYEQLLKKAKKDLMFSFVPGKPEQIINSRQERADFILYYILEMSSEEADRVWEEAQQEYNEAHKEA